MARLYPVAVAIAGIVATLMVVAHAGTTVRPFVVLPFLVVGPGSAIVTLLDVGDALERLVLAVAISLSLEVLLSIGMLYGGVWSPSLGISTLSGIVVVATALLYTVGPRAPSRSRSPVDRLGEHADHSVR